MLDRNLDTEIRGKKLCRPWRRDPDLPSARVVLHGEGKFGQQR
jgi:hypothetical protein